MYRINEKPCDDRNLKTNNKIDPLKQQLISYIYTTVDLGKYKYEVIENESSLSQLVERKDFVSANFSGSNCLLVFTKLKDKYYSFLVERKTLSYNFQRVNISNVNLTNVKVKLDINIYDGSIFDGVLIKSKTETTFVITDVYCFKGTNMANTKLDSKLFSVIKYLESNYKQDSIDNDIVLTINKLYEISETENLINNDIPKISKNFSVRGICFYPETSGTKLIYMFDNGSFSSNFSNGKTHRIQSQNDFNGLNSLNNSNNPNNPNNLNIVNNFNRRNRSNSNYSTHSTHSIQSNNSNLETISPSPLRKATSVATSAKKYIPKKNVADNSYVFEMKKTENVDVYMLYAVEAVQKDQKTCLKRIKICLAYIPNNERTKWCTKVMDENTDGANILVKCKFYPEKNKWEPVEVSSSKRPSYITDFDVTY